MQAGFGSGLGLVGTEAKRQILAMCILYWLTCSAPKSHSALRQCTVAGRVQRHISTHARVFDSCCIAYGTSGHTHACDLLSHHADPICSA
jgi:hypothetical protein